MRYCGFVLAPSEHLWEEGQSEHFLYMLQLGDGKEKPMSSGCGVVIR